MKSAEKAWKGFTSRAKPFQAFSALFVDKSWGGGLGTRLGVCVCESRSASSGERERHTISSAWSCLGGAAEM